jgi:hypothetical protein
MLMTKEPEELPPPVCDLYDEIRWTSLYYLLLSLVNRWVYSANISIWPGQERDVIWDIVLVAIQRTFEYAAKVQKKGKAVTSLESLAVTIARNYYRDLLRKERRVVRFDQEPVSPGNEMNLYNLVDPSELAFDTMYSSWLFTKIAYAVAGFPQGARNALLIDLASRMSFEDGEPTALQLAFLNVGIRLQDYQDLLPVNPIAKSRYASQLSIAYKRLAKVLNSGRNSLAA